jgi:phosphoglucomutase
LSGITNRIFDVSRELNEYHICPSIQIDLNRLGLQQFSLSSGQTFEVQVIDSIDAYLQLLKNIFDFDSIRSYVQQSGVKFLFDSLHGVTGPYAQRVFVEELNLPAESVRHGQSLPDFGGLHPDPNLTYAADLLNQMKLGQHDLGVAFDGDGDRNMILGKNGFFVTPSDSLAVIAANLHLIPYYEKKSISGFARSMPTAPAVDQVAKKLGK